MRVSRRLVLRGIGGVTLGLPLLESLGRPVARAQDQAGRGFAVFLRQANGVASAQRTEVGAEPERFWPRQPGALTPDTLRGRALEELVDHRARLLVVGNVNAYDFPYGDGHARGAMQGLTARGPTVANAGGDSEAAGESLDHLIGTALNPAGRESMFLYAGRNGGWLGGACISYRAAGQRRAPYHNPQNAYAALAGTSSESPEAAQRRARRARSVNDLLRDQIQGLLGHPRLGQADRQRLELHLASVRDLEVSLGCRMARDEEARLDGADALYASTQGDEVLETTRLHMDIAALAIACGYTRSVAIQVGNGNDGSTRYRNLQSGAPMENYHYISHRRLSHDSSGAVLAGSDLLHHYVDRQFAQTFRHLLDRLAAYDVPGGGSLLEEGVAVWYNDNGNGPGHASRNLPYVIAGSGGGFLKQGQYVQLSGGERASNHNRLLITLANAAGVRGPDGSLFDHFGDPMFAGGALGELLA